MEQWVNTPRGKTRQTRRLAAVGPGSVPDPGLGSYDNPARTQRDDNVQQRITRRWRREKPSRQQ